MIVGLMKNLFERLLNFYKPANPPDRPYKAKAKRLRHGVGAALRGRPGFEMG